MAGAALAAAQNAVQSQDWEALGHALDEAELEVRGARAMPASLGVQGEAARSPTRALSLSPSPSPSLAAGAGSPDQRSVAPRSAPAGPRLRGPPVSCSPLAASAAARRHLPLALPLSIGACVVLAPILLPCGNRPIPPHLPPTRREDARFLYKRTPDAVKAARPELQAAWALLQRVWTKDYRAVWAALQVGRMQGLLQSVAGARAGWPRAAPACRRSLHAAERSLPPSPPSSLAPRRSLGGARR